MSLDATHPPMVAVQQPMPDIWPMLALQLLAVLSGAATAGVALVLGGVGVLRQLRGLDDRITDLDGRHTREVKRRAADAATASREEKKTIEQQAADVLAEAGRQPSGKRPSVAAVK